MPRCAIILYMNVAVCMQCTKALTRRWQQKYCSNQCQADARYEIFKKEWLKDKKEIITKNISGHIKRYLIEKFGEKCSECGWNKKHPTTGRVPIEVDHINGNADDNDSNNVRLVCPNCHALTPSFRNLNKGKGRSWRKARK